MYYYNIIVLNVKFASLLINFFIYLTIKIFVLSAKYFISSICIPTFALQSPIAFSYCNSFTYSESTPILLLGIHFNTISHFSDNLSGTYLPNILRHSKYIYQRG